MRAYGRLENPQPIDIHPIIHLLFISLFFLSFFYHRALAALGFGDLCRFALKSGRLFSTKARGSLLLCSESNRPSSRKYDSIVVLHGSFVWQHFPACGIVYVKCQASPATLQINVWCSRDFKKMFAVVVGFIVAVCKSLMSIA
jgi:hypothetical protein